MKNKYSDGDSPGEARVQPGDDLCGEDDVDIELDGI